MPSPAMQQSACFKGNPTALLHTRCKRSAVIHLLLLLLSRYKGTWDAISCNATVGLLRGRTHYPNACYEQPWEVVAVLHVPLLLLSRYKGTWDALCRIAKHDNNSLSVSCDG